MVTTERKTELKKQFGRKAKDTGSPEVQVAILTERIQDLTQHFKSHPKDHSGMRGMMKLIGQRRSFLKYLELRTPERYQAVIKELGLRK